MSFINLQSFAAGVFFNTIVCVFGRRRMVSSDVSEGRSASNFDVLLTVHLSIILVINQLNAQILVL